MPSESKVGTRTLIRYLWETCDDASFRDIKDMRFGIGDTAASGPDVAVRWRLRFSGGPGYDRCGLNSRRTR